MRVQYVHVRFWESHFVAVDEDLQVYTREESISPNGGTTVSMEEISLDKFYMLNINDTIDVHIGVAECSLDDKYNKKIGRELSSSRMELNTLTVTGSEGVDGENFLYLEDVEGNLYTLRHYTGHKRVHLIGYESHE